MTMPELPDRVADLNLDPNEASGLLRVRDDALLRHFGWDLAFWSVLDEVDVEECVVLIGRLDGDTGQEAWAAQRLETRRDGHPAPAKDAEAVAFWDGFVYVVGSHHGGKSGPIRREEQWVARFTEADVVGDGRTVIPRVRLTVVDTRFALHRMLNDALHECDIDLVAMPDLTRRSFIDTTLDDLSGTPEEGRVQAGDWTVNIEGAEFTPDGDMLLGLRFPVAADGRPLIVQVADWPGLFAEPARLPRVTGVWSLDAVGRNGSMAGVRDVCFADGDLHVITGDLDSAGKGSVIREDFPGGNQTVSTHFAMALPSVQQSTPASRVVKEFPDNPRIEGLAADGEGRFFYVSDEDESIIVRCTPLLTGSE